MRARVAAAAALMLASFVAPAWAQQIIAIPRADGGYALLNPGQMPTFVIPRDGGYAIIAPGGGTTLLHHVPGGPYAAFPGGGGGDDD